MRHLIPTTLAAISLTLTPVYANTTAGCMDINTNPVVLYTELDNAVSDGISNAIKKIKADEAAEKERLRQEAIARAKENEIIFLAKCAYAESNNQSEYGIRLVIDVILNRVDSPKFANNIYGVITERHQFETWANGMVNASPATERIIRLVREEMSSRTNNQILYFTAGYYNPYCTPAFKEGAHYFGY